jgi:hypothetical protein
VVVAIRTGVGPDVWLADTRALTTAVDILNEQDRRERSARRR